MAVHLVYTGRRGHAAVDRELYVPRSWTADPDRCRAAGLGEETPFATKPELAARMVTRFLDAGHRAAWVAGDEVYGGNPKLRTAPEERGTGYVLAVACSHEVTTGAGKFRADALAKKVPKRAWQKLSAGAGAKGHRFYDWAVIDVADPRPGSRQLLIRRNRNTGELAYYRCYSPAPVPLTTLARVAGARWRVEEFFQSGKGLAALDEHQVRRYPSWSHWVTLAMLAHAFLAVVRADEHARQPAPDDLIPLTCNEIQRLFITLVVQPVHDAVHPSAGPTGDAATRPDPRPATTDDKPLRPCLRSAARQVYWTKSRQKATVARGFQVSGCSWPSSNSWLMYSARSSP